MVKGVQKFGAFGEGNFVPKIAILNIATVDLGVDYMRLCKALNVYAKSYFSPIWNTPCTIEVVPPGVKTIPKNAFAMIFADDADEANALGYHEVSKDNLPICYVFVKTSQAAGEKVSVTASHELAEMLVDPACNLWAMDGRGLFWAYETADAVEDLEFAIDGVPMSNFLFPSAFEPFRKPKSVKFDYMGKTTKPFQILKNGYSIISRGGRPQSVFAHEGKAKHFSTEDRRMHRSERRGPPVAPVFGKSIPQFKHEGEFLLMSDIEREYGVL